MIAKHRKERSKRKRKRQRMVDKLAWLSEEDFLNSRNIDYLNSLGKVERQKQRQREVENLCFWFSHENSQIFQYKFHFFPIRFLSKFSGIIYYEISTFYFTIIFHLFYFFNFLPAFMFVFCVLCSVRYYGPTTAAEKSGGTREVNNISI